MPGRMQMSRGRWSRRQQRFAVLLCVDLRVILLNERWIWSRRNLFVNYRGACAPERVHAPLSQRLLRRMPVGLELHRGLPSIGVQERSVPALLVSSLYGIILLLVFLRHGGCPGKLGPAVLHLRRLLLQLRRPRGSDVAVADAGAEPIAVAVADTVANNSADTPAKADANAATNVGADAGAVAISNAVCRT